MTRTPSFSALLVMLEQDMTQDPDITKILADDFSWMHVRRYEMDANAPWQDKYLQLQRHHLLETEVLLRKLKELAQVIQDAQGSR